MGITLTENAAQHIDRMLESQPEAKGLRFGVKTSGCSGFQYVVDYASEISNDDEVFEFHGVKIVVDSKSLAFVDGTEIDYGLNGLTEGLQFNNPKSKNECGCGESFTV